MQFKGVGNTEEEYEDTQKISCLEAGKEEYMAEYYREHLLKMIDKISSEKNLMRLYELAQYLYIHKETGVRKDGASNE